MEEEIFEEKQLVVDEQAKIHLLDATKWARFLAVLGIILAILIALSGLFIGSLMSLFMANLSNSDVGNNLFMSGGASIGASILYIGLAVLYFVPCLYLYRFAGRTKKAVMGMDQEKLNKGMYSLYRFFKFVGILTIIYLIIMVLAIVGGAVGAMMGATL